MFDRASKLRFRRKIRMRQRQITSFGKDTEEQLDEHLISRLDNLVPVRRFVISWLVLVGLLIAAVSAQTLSLNNFFQEFRPVAGGTYIEGVIGEFTNANPLYASSGVDATVSKLLFSGLLTYDENNQLVGDLAESWESDDRGQIYTVTLRDNLRWHDGTALTVDDIVFTYETIQNADAGSPLRPGFQGVGIKALDAQTVEFTLPNPLASFPYGLTNGIVPKHILASAAPADLRSVAFNTTEPIGSGPFEWRGLEVEGNDLSDRIVQIALVRSADYHLGEPMLDRMNVHVFRSAEQMLDQYNARELTAMAGLPAIPTESEVASAYSFNQTAAVMTFFKTTEGVLADKAVRQALVRSTNTSAVRDLLGYPARRIDAPILPGQIGYNSEITQIGFDKAAAQKQLTDAGWILAEGSEIRSKGEQRLEFSLYAEDNPETARVSRELQSQWREIGVQVNVELQDAREFQITLSQHSYDALLRGIAIGLDPDVFPFWHSSQADGRLNFSEYSSAVADEGLESARTRIDPALRAEKYKPFLEVWREDAPAVGLYQPRSLYITRTQVYGLTPHEVNSSVDRFANVHEWMIRRAKTTVE